MEALPEGVGGARRSVRPPPLPVSRISAAPIDRDEVDGFPFGSLAGAMPPPVSRWKLVVLVVGGAVVLGAGVGAAAYFLSGPRGSTKADAGTRPGAVTAAGRDAVVVAVGPNVVAAGLDARSTPTSIDAGARPDAVDPDATATVADDAAEAEAPGEAVPEAGEEDGPPLAAEVPAAPTAEEAGAVEPEEDVAAIAVEPPEEGDEEDAGPSVWRLVALADHAMALRDFDKARQLYFDVLDIRPGFRRARAGIGKIAFQEGDFEEACRFLEPLYAERGNMMLGVIYTRLNRLRDARHQFERILRRTPNSVEAQRALEAVNRQLGTD
jgi:hypothetical protein